MKISDGASRPSTNPKSSRNSVTTPIAAGAIFVLLLIFKEFKTYSPTAMFRMIEQPHETGTGILTPQTTNTASSYTAVGTPTAETPTTTQNQGIRKWGCHRRETPLIFVHIGKAGGGEIRASLAMSAEDYQRKKWNEGHLDNHYYPIDADTDTGTSSATRKGKFCNSRYANSNLLPKNNFTKPLSYRTKTFEGNKLCNATTPFGHIIACPMTRGFTRRYGYGSKLCDGCDDEYYLETAYYEYTHVEADEQLHAVEKLLDPPPPEHTCDLVYVSHNYLGGELNWLPPRFLKEHWWDKSPWKTNDNQNPLDEEIEKYWARLLVDRKVRMGQVLSTLKNKNLTLYQKIVSVTNHNESDYKVDVSQRWCPEGYRSGFEEKGNLGNFYDRPRVSIARFPEDSSQYENCRKPLGEATDRVFREFWREHQKGGLAQSQLASSENSNYAPVYASIPVHRVTMIREPLSWLLSRYFWDNSMHHSVDCYDIHGSGIENPNMSWIEVYSYSYLFYLCGYECDIRFQNGMIDLDTIEAQASDNLRTSFSVVGLLENSDSFYQMVHKRIAYVDLNKTIKIGQQQRHQSMKTGKEYQQCKALFSGNETFRETVRSELPVFAALERVYKVGVQVHLFQKEELAQCN